MASTSTLVAVPAFLAQVLSIHAIVAVAFCAFLGWQLHLFFGHRRSVRTQRNLLESLWRQKGEPTRNLGLGKSDVDWLGWVSTKYHEGAFDDGQIDRKGAIEELHDWLEGHACYLLLQRTQIMAPLVGVLITATGFLFIQSPSEPDGDLGQILHNFMPIVLGVGTGASLALVNQLLLHICGKGTERVRKAACRWFDDCIWSPAQAKPRTTVNNAADTVRDMADTMRTSIEQFQKVTAAVGQTAESLKTAGSTLVQTVEQYRTDTAAIPEEMKKLRNTAATVIESLGSIVPNVERTTQELAESVRAFNAVVQKQLGHAAERHLKSAELLAGSVDQIRESAAQVSSQFSSLGQAASLQATASQEWSRSLRDDVLPAQRAFRQAGDRLADAVVDLAPTQKSFREAAQSMHGSANVLAAFVRDGVAPATQRLTELDQLLARIQEAGEVVRQMSQCRQEFADFAASLSQAAAAAESIRSLPQEMRGVLRTVARNNYSRPSPKRSFLSRLLGRSSSNGHASHDDQR